MKSQDVDNRITHLLAYLVTVIRASNAIDRTDINRIAQNLIVPIFSTVYEYKELRNLDTETGLNSPAIDLADDTARIAIQVTATNKLSKVNETLLQFLKEGMHHKYERLIVYVLTEKQRTYSQTSCDRVLNGKFNFDTRRDIRDYRNLLRDVQLLSMDQKRQVLEILDTTVGEPSQPSNSIEPGRPIDLLWSTISPSSALHKYRKHVTQSWHEAWLSVSDADAQSAPPPFIATQGLRILNKSKPHLNPRDAINSSYFRRVRDEDTTREKRSPRIATLLAENDLIIDFKVTTSETWPGISRASLVNRLVTQDPDRLRRVMLTTDAGLGKTTNMRWLQTAINESDTGCTAVLLNVADLPGPEDAPLDRVLAALVLRAPGGEVDIGRDQMSRFLLARRDAGEIILLIDALDQVDLSSAASFRRLQNLLRDPRWDNCPLILGSRPFALHRDWLDLFGSDYAPGWDIIQVEEFTPAEQRAYLGDERFNHIPQGAKEILGVPRVLYYLLMASEDEFQRIATASDVYWLATSRLLVDGLRARASEGLNPDAARLLLGAIAFEMSVERQNFDQVREDSITHFLRDVSRRCRAFDEECGLDWVQRTLRQVVSMNEFLACAILEAGFPRQVKWRNRSLQEFFAALWACKYASDSDLSRLARFQYTAGDDGAANYYWIWRFGVEMPSVGRTKACWLGLVSPLLERKRSKCSKSPRPTEMIYRAWVTLSNYLEPTDGAPECVEKARQLFNGFRNEISRIVSGGHGRRAMRVAEQLLASFVLVPPGGADSAIAFQMGSTAEEKGRGNSEPRHTHLIECPFSLNRYAVTAEQLELFDPQHIGRKDAGRWRPRYPAIHVTWYDAWVFCRWLGDSYRLPTEAEWEFACRAGTSTSYSFGDDAHWLRRFARCGVHADGTPNPVGCLRPNQWGLYDMHGNSWEWCADWYSQDPANERSRASGQTYRVARGGACNTSRYRLRSAERAFREPDDSGGAIGFRVLREEPTA